MQKIVNPKQIQLFDPFDSVLNYEKPDVFPVMEFMGFWPGVSLCWANELGNQDIFEHFGLMKVEYLPIDFNPDISFPLTIVFRQSSLTKITKLTLKN